MKGKRGQSAENFAKDWDFTARYVSLMMRQTGVKKEECSKRFHADDILIFGKKMKRIIVEWQGSRLIRPRIVDRD